MTIDAAQKNDIDQAAAALVPVWKESSQALATWPDGVTVDSEDQAYAVQKETLALLGGHIGGWKVGASGLGTDAVFSCAPMPLDYIRASPAILDSHHYTYRGVEAEICFRLGSDLPTRATSYTRAEIVAAIASAHPAIEILQPRFQNPDLDRITQLADCISHGGFVYGPKIVDWQSRDWDQDLGQMIVDGQTQISHTGNPAGEMMRLIVWLANEGARWAGGLYAGQFITCGSWTGKLPVGSNTRIVANFGAAGKAELRFTTGQE